MFRSLLIATVVSVSGYGCVGDNPVDLGALAKPVTVNAAYQVKNGDFEIAGCSGWTAGESTLADATPPLARSGAHACLVCSEGKADSSVYGLTQRIAVTNLKAGSTYTAVVYARAPGADKKTATGLVASLFVDTGVGGEALLDSGEVRIDSLTDQYKVGTTAAVRFENRPRAQDLVVRVINRGIDGGCFIVDDIAVTEQ